MTVDRIPVIDPIDISIFNYGQNDLVLCKREIDESSVTLTMQHTQDPSVFSESQFEVQGNVNIIEVSESNNFDNPFLRMIGIRDCEEVICWEVKDKCHGEKT